MMMKLLVIGTLFITAGSSTGSAASINLKADRRALQNERQVTSGAGSPQTNDGGGNGGGTPPNCLKTCPEIPKDCIVTTCQGAGKANVEIKNCFGRTVSFLGTEIDASGVCNKDGSEPLGETAVKTLTDVPCNSVITIVAKDGQFCPDPGFTRTAAGACVNNDNQLADACVYKYPVNCGSTDGEPCEGDDIIEYDPEDSPCADGGEYKSCECVQKYKDDNTVCEEVKLEVGEVLDECVLPKTCQDGECEVCVPSPK